MGVTTYVEDYSIFNVAHIAIIIVRNEELRELVFPEEVFLGDFNLHTLGD